MKRRGKRGALHIEVCGQCSQPYPEIALGRCIYCHLDECISSDKMTIGDVLTELWHFAICAYCGMPAAEREHVVPRRLKLKTWLVPACKECNLLAGGTPFLTFASKREYIRGKLERKYRKILSIPEWDRYEIQELGPGLKPYVSYSELMRRVIIQRLSFCIEGLDSESITDVANFQISLSGRNKSDAA